MAYTSLTSVVAAVGQRWKAASFNLMITAVQELQAALPGLTDVRPQLRVYAPASVTSGSKIPYATTRKDNKSGWSGSYYYTVPSGFAGLWQCNVGYKCGAAAATPSQYVNVFRSAVNAAVLSGPNSASGSYLGSSVSGVIDLQVGDQVSVIEQGATYTPQNDATGNGGTGSNYFHLTYLGPTT